MYDTEEELLSAASDAADLVAQRAVRLRTKIRGIGRAAMARHAEDTVETMVQLHFFANVALMGMHEIKGYGFMTQELLGQRKERDPVDPDPFNGLPVVNEVSIEEAVELLDECEDGLTDHD